MEMLRRGCLKVISDLLGAMIREVIKMDRENGVRTLQSERVRGDAVVTHIHAHLPPWG